MPTASDPAHGLLLESLPDAVVASIHERALRLLYPRTAADLETLGGSAESALSELRDGAGGDLESIVVGSPYQERAAALASEMAEGLRR